jgi:hypothetical protein|tara:strand:- start:4145 stop:4438 length:294 start_codon:yes stop_codon:yes gene_type:complete
MREGLLQKYYKSLCAKHEVFWRKIKFEGQNGCPDTFIAHKGRVIWIELKSDKGKLSKIQIWQIKQMKAAGLDVRVINSKEKIDDTVKEIIGETTGSG